LPLVLPRAPVLLPACGGAVHGMDGSDQHVPQPEVQMNTLKYRTYPFLIAAVSVLAATGAAWRAN
jgi:hypothetical protein